MPLPGDLYQSYLKGFTDGASAKRKRPEFINHNEDTIVSTYDMGYRDGALRRDDARRKASHISGYKPSILREVT